MKRFFTMCSIFGMFFLPAIIFPIADYWSSGESRTWQHSHDSTPFERPSSELWQKVANDDIDQSRARLECFEQGTQFEERQARLETKSLSLHNVAVSVAHNFNKKMQG